MLTQSNEAAQRAVAHARKCMSVVDETAGQMVTLGIKEMFDKKPAHTGPLAFLRPTSEKLRRRLDPEMQKVEKALDLAFEVAGLSAARERFLRDWRALVESPDPNRVHLHQTDRMQFLRETLSALEAAYGSEPEAVRTEREILEYLLRGTARIVLDRGVSPTKEADIQDVMDFILRHTFRSYVRKPQIPKPVRNFNADAGIRDLRVGIEYKFVDSQSAVGVAIEGLSADLSGYAGSRDWTHFYSVIYQTSPSFIHEEQARKAFKAGGHDGQWEFIVVSGPGVSSSSPPTTPSATPRSTKRGSRRAAPRPRKSR